MKLPQVKNRRYLYEGLCMKTCFKWFVVFFMATAWFVPWESVAAAAVGTAGPDYGNSKYWIALPDKADKPVDVFFMHPTTYLDQKDGMNASLDNETVNAASKSVTAHQGGVFAGTCNLYAPHYRQASIAVLGLDEKAQETYLSVGLGDMAAAFRYYMENFNQGRPLILAGHSQGSNLTLWFLSRYSALVPSHRLVAAYLIGWSVTDRDLEQLGLPLGEKPEQTGCIITWNTISQGGKSPVILPGAHCVNPLNWSTDDSNVPAAFNIFALIHLADGSKRRIPHFTGARIDHRQGSLVIPVPGIDGELDHNMGPGIYHGYDYDFFYGNLLENVATRCNAWLKQRKQD